MKITKLLLMSLAAGLCSIIMTGCKDDNSDDQPSKRSYRLKSLSDVTGRASLNFIYDDFGKVTKLSMAEDGVENYKYEWNWNGDTLLISHADYENGIWDYSTDKERIIYSNGKIQSYESTINSDTKTTFTWNGDLLMQETYSFYYNDSLYWLYTRDYVYEQGRLAEMNITVNDNQFEKKIIQYDNGRPISVKTYDQGVLQESIGFTYTGINVTTISMYDVYQGVEVGVDCLQDRTYDINNCVETSTDKCDGEIENYFSYKYERRDGNFDDYLIANGHWVFVCLFPNSFPLQDIVLKK